MHRIILIVLMAFGSFIFTEDVFAQQVYKSVDKSGTINFSDNPTSSVLDEEKGPCKENGIDVLKKSEMAGRPLGKASGGKTIRLGYSTRSGGGSSSGGGGSKTVRKGRS